MKGLGSKEPTLKELTMFITAHELQTENDPVYGRPSNLTSRAETGRNSRKPLCKLGQYGETHISTLSTEIQTNGSSIYQVDEVPTAKGQQVGRVEQSERSSCRVWKRKHNVSECSAFAKKSLHLRRRFSSPNALCYRYLSSSHMRKGCSETKGCDVKNCPHVVTHRSLLHVTIATSNVDKGEESVNHSTPPTKDVAVTATLEDSKRSFVLLKVVPLSIVGKNRTIVTTYGLLDSVR